MKTQEVKKAAPAQEPPAAEGKTMAPPAFSLQASPADGGGGGKPKEKDYNKEPKKGLFAKTERIDGPLEAIGEGDKHPISPNDLEQGALSDCTIIASLIAVASASPKALEDLVCDNGDGTYIVRLAVPTVEGAFEWKEIVVKPDFVTTKKGGAKYARAFDKGEIWPLLFEKAFAQVEGSYRKIIGKDYEQALSALTGKKSETLEIEDLDDDELMFQLGYATKMGRPVIAGTKSKIEMSKLSPDVDKTLVSIDHQYAVIRTSRADGTITLRNPWEHAIEMVVTVADFRLIFDDFTMQPRYDK